MTIFTYNAEAIDTGINYLRAQYAGFFDAMTHILRQSLLRVEVAFMQTPWPVTAFLFLALSWVYQSCNHDFCRRLTSLSSSIRAMADCDANNGTGCCCLPRYVYL